MVEKEAKARIKINKLLEEAGWRLLDSSEGKANVILESNTKITKHGLDELGEDFERTSKGFIDFLLLDDKGFPIVVLEAKAEHIEPLIGKEQARTYALNQRCRYVILSNGNSHYLWDLERGNPNPITRFPSPDMIEGYSSFKPDRTSLVKERVESDYIVLTQRPDYKTDPSYIDPVSRTSYISENKLRFLRKYQVEAVHSIQKAVEEGKDRFLFEMATGTGKTLVSAAAIKLFLRTGNAKRILFLVDRLELEDQANKALGSYLHNDFMTVIYKESFDDWHKAEIVVSTVQTLLSNNRYKRIFSPNDFDLVISDEAHRSIGGNSRAVFEYFMGFKLGLTATPKEYLKNIDSAGMSANDPRQLERRTLLDTYRTFGCESGEPTFRYSLNDGVRDGYLVNPIVVDVRTEISTQLLSELGYAVELVDEEGEQAEAVFQKRDFEKKFFSDNTNEVFCKTFLDNALKDPYTGEVGKTIVYCVTQNHAAKITQMLNIVSDKMYPGRYKSDFAIQVTSRIPEAQQSTINFTNNNLSGNGNFDARYRTSKTRVCVTVGMMTTGYDCPDLLNLCLMRPIFSPTDFIQIKGRGTRKNDFTQGFSDNRLREELGPKEKEHYKMFDFFGNFRYFEEEYNYDEVIKLPVSKSGMDIDNGDASIPVEVGAYDSTSADKLASLDNKIIGSEGMKIDRMYFEKFESRINQHPDIIEKANAGQWDDVEKEVIDKVFDKPEDFFNLDKLRKAANVDRRLSIREVIEKILGKIPYFKSKDELLEDEFDKFDSRYMPNERCFSHAKTVFKAYVADAAFREIIDRRDFARLNVTPYGEDFRKLPPEFRELIPEYIKDYVPLNRFIA